MLPAGFKELGCLVHIAHSRMPHTIFLSNLITEKEIRGRQFSTNPSAERNVLSRRLPRISTKLRIRNSRRTWLIIEMWSSRSSAWIWSVIQHILPCSGRHFFFLQVGNSHPPCSFAISFTPINFLLLFFHYSAKQRHKTLPGMVLQSQGHLGVTSIYLFFNEHNASVLNAEAYIVLSLV